MATTQTAPTENGIALDDFNAALRASPAWQQFITQSGYRLDGSPIKLNSNQRVALRTQLQAAGITLPEGMEIDPAGNVNQDQGWSKWKKPVLTTALITGASLATLGAAGYGPLAGVLHGGAAAGGGLTSAGVGGSLPGVSGTTLAGLQGATVAGSGAGVAGGLTAAGAAGAAGAGTTAATGGGILGFLRGTAGQDLIRYGLPVAGALVGQHMASNAEKDAAQLEYQATEEALADARAQREYDQKFAEDQRAYERATADELKTYNRGQYSDYLGRLAPFTAAAPPAIDRLNALLGMRR